MSAKYARLSGYALALFRFSIICIILLTGSVLASDSQAEADIAPSEAQQLVSPPPQIEKVELTVHIVGLVTSAMDGQGVSGALIVAKQSGVTRGTTTTAPDGTYLFPQIAPGIYMIEVSHSSFFPTSRLVTAVSGIGATANFVLNSNASHSGDTNKNHIIELTENLRVIQLYNSNGYHCADNPGSTEDGYKPYTGENHTCAPHDSDYFPQDWYLNLSELLRFIQFYNSDGYYACPTGEDGFCPIN